VLNRLERLVVEEGILRDERGQDLIEYTLILALIALAATVGMNSVATGINTAFTKVATKLSSATS
jgi:Flp pilus assembly pilin Flp